VENRRWCAFHARDVLKEMALVRGADGRLNCSEAIRRSVGLSYDQMVALAAKANFRRALEQIGEAIAEMMAATLRRSARWTKLAGERGPNATAGRKP